MARGGSRGKRTYNRDARGRFASGGGSGTPKPRRGAIKPGGGTLKARAGLARSKGRLAAADPADRSLRGALSRRSQKGAVTKARKALAEAKKAARVRLGISGAPKGTIRRPKGRKAGTPQVKPFPRNKKTKTDQQIVSQVKRISERAFARDKVIGERTVAALESAVGRVASRAQRRQGRAEANITRIEGLPNSGGRRNRSRSLAQQGARWAYSQLRQAAENVQSDVRQNATMTSAIKQRQYDQSKEGKSAKRRRRAAEAKASREWARRNR